MNSSIETGRFRYAGWPAEAVDLVERAIAVHGGWEEWKRLEAVFIKPISLRGPLPAMKGYGRTFGLPRMFELRPHRGVAIFHGFPNQETYGIWEQGVVSLVETKTTETLLGSRDHRKTFKGKAKRRKWSPLDALYFFGYALLHYHSIPFMLGEADFAGIRNVQSKGENLTALALDFPAGYHTHCRRQTFFFGKEGLVRRHDYVAEVVGSWARGSHFWGDYELVDGFMFPLTRCVKARFRDWPLPLTVLDARFSEIRAQPSDPD